MIRLLRRAFHYLYFQSWSRRLWSPKDRVFLENTIFPHYAADPKIKKILFVGVQRYTRGYEKFFPQQSFVTVDYDPNVAKYGATTHHAVNLLEFHGSDFDLVILNGVIGYGLDEIEAVQKAMVKLVSLMVDGALLMVGTNPWATSTRMFEVLETCFRMQEFPPSGKFVHVFNFPLSSAQHEYRFFRRLENNDFKECAT